MPSVLLLSFLNQNFPISYQVGVVAVPGLTMDAVYKTNFFTITIQKRTNVAQTETSRRQTSVKNTAKCKFWNTENLWNSMTCLIYFVN